jgi:hypothetical protein
MIVDLSSVTFIDEGKELLKNVPGRHRVGGGRVFKQVHRGRNHAIRTSEEKGGVVHDKTNDKIIDEKHRADHEPEPLSKERESGSNAASQPKRWTT